jgi:hypothetical protein
MPLGLILRQLEEKGNIWSKGGEWLLKEKVTVSFKNLSLEEGLKRILYRVNYSLMFDNGGALTGVIIAGRSNTGNNPHGGRAVTAGKALNSTAIETTPIKQSAESVAGPPLPVISRSIPADSSKIPRGPKNINRDSPGISPILKNRMSDQ